MSKEKPEVLTKREVLKLIDRFVKKHDSASQAAAEIGITPAQLSRAINDKEPPPPKLLKAIGVKRAVLYVHGSLPIRYRDGSHDL